MIESKPGQRLYRDALGRAEVLSAEASSSAASSSSPLLLTPPRTPIIAPRPVVIGVAGGTGSGKSTCCSIIRSRIGSDNISYLPHDNYYKDLGHLPSEKRKEVNFDHPDSIETELLVKHIDMLLRGRPVEVPVYDFATHTRRSDRTIHVQPRKVILVEGILIFTDPRLRDLCDIKIFVDADPDVRFIRRLTRDVRDRGRSPDDVSAQWMQTVRPMHIEFVEPSKRYADVIIPDGGLNTVATDMVVDRIRTLLQSSNPRQEASSSFSATTPTEPKKTTTQQKPGQTNNGGHLTIASVGSPIGVA